MNKFSIREFLRCELAEHTSSFKETSYDEVNAQNVCQDESTADVYDFDAYVRTKHDKSKLPASPDAVYIGHKHLYFVEFKNQPANAVSKENIQRKFRCGTAILQSLLTEFKPRDCKYNFCVVFHTQKKPRYFDGRHIEQSAVHFELDRLNAEFNNFYDQIFTADARFFAEKFSELQCQAQAA